jgi:aspartate/methionine/tyrosine aminotransferase
MPIREFQLERYFAQWEFEAPYLLSASDCETMDIGELLALAAVPLTDLAALRLGYTESKGDPALRETIARFYPGLSADEIIVTNAPEEAIFLTMMVLLQPGDRVVVQTPCYQSLLEVAVFRGCMVEPWPMVETETGWRMDLDHLAELLTPNTRLLVINAPHNPTGYLPSAGEFKTILNLVSERDIRLFCDEMYRGLEYKPADRLPSASSRYERAISLWGMSKTFGLAGLRLGWLVSQDRDLLQALLKFKDYTTICSSAPSEFLARVALEQADALIERNLDIIQTNLDHVHQFVAAQTDLFDWREPLAGPIVFARLNQGQADEFCRQAVQEAGVMLVPSTLFDFGNSHLRFGLGRRNFPEGLAVLADYVVRLKENFNLI